MVGRGFLVPSPNTPMLRNAGGLKFETFIFIGPMSAVFQVLKWPWLVLALA